MIIVTAINSVSGPVRGRFLLSLTRPESNGRLLEVRQQPLFYPKEDAYDLGCPAMMQSKLSTRSRTRGTFEGPNRGQGCYGAAAKPPSVGCTQSKDSKGDVDSYVNRMPPLPTA